MLDIEPLGDRALTIRLGDSMDRSLAAQARRVASRLRTTPGVLEAVPGYATVTAFYDPAATSYELLITAVTPMADLTPMTATTPAEQAVGAEHVIPVRYDGPDLDEVARRTGLTSRQVVERHAAGAYTVYLIGFVPGFAYLGDLDPALDLPRRDQPRTRVPAGSVAIAGRQTAVYPLDTPGGWHLIGHTDTSMFDPLADPPAKLAAGDRVRFVPTTA
jgi:KipI family sensor histidine kinase inhibitor